MFCRAPELPPTRLRLCLQFEHSRTRFVSGDLNFLLQRRQEASPGFSNSSGFGFFSEGKATSSVRLRLRLLQHRDLMHDHRFGWPVERSPPGSYFIDHHRQRPLIHAAGQRPPFPLLRRHVRWRGPFFYPVFQRDGEVGILAPIEWRGASNGDLRAYG